MLNFFYVLCQNNRIFLIQDVSRSFYSDLYEFDWLTKETTTGFYCLPVFSMLASIITSGNLLYGPYACNYDEYKLQ